MEEKFTEQDLQQLFALDSPPKIDSEPIQQESGEGIRSSLVNNFYVWFSNTLKTLVLFILIFCISFAALNFPALLRQGKYFWRTQQNDVPTTQVTVSRPLIENNRLIIPKISLNVPINWEVSEEETLKSLETGVAHFKGTALPGEIGNVFISGHSSYYWWADGLYKDVFALLDKLEQGDKIYVNYKDHQFTYIVTGKKVVKPQEVSVLDQGQSRELSLMTCVPIGTNLNRLIIKAELQD